MGTCSVAEKNTGRQRINTSYSININGSINNGAASKTSCSLNTADVSMPRYPASPLKPPSQIPIYQPRVTFLDPLGDIDDFLEQRLPIIQPTSSHILPKSPKSPKSPGNHESYRETLGNQKSGVIVKKEEKIRFGPYRNTGPNEMGSPIKMFRSSRSSMSSALNIVDYPDSDRYKKQGLKGEQHNVCPESPFLKNKRRQTLAYQFKRETLLIGEARKHAILNQTEAKANEKVTEDDASADEADLSLTVGFPDKRSIDN